jgi:putative membrane protein
MNANKHPEPALDTSTRLAYDRTWLAYERTMNAWTRTSVSLITFGFSIYKAVDVLSPGPSGAPRRIGPHIFGLSLVLLGLATLVLAAIEHGQSIRLLSAQYGGKPRAMSVIFGGLVALVGICALAFMFYRP